MAQDQTFELGEEVSYGRGPMPVEEILVKYDEHNPLIPRSTLYKVGGSWWLPGSLRKKPKEPAHPYEVGSEVLTMVDGYVARGYISGYQCDLAFNSQKITYDIELLHEFHYMNSFQRLVKAVRKDSRDVLHAYDASGVSVPYVTAAVRLSGPSQECYRAKAAVEPPKKSERRELPTPAEIASLGSVDGRMESCQKELFDRWAWQFRTRGAEWFSAQKLQIHLATTRNWNLTPGQVRTVLARTIVEFREALEAKGWDVRATRQPAISVGYIDGVQFEVFPRPAK